MRFKKRKVYQKELNKVIKEINKSIETDWLWLGRFVIHQMDAYWEEFEDGSGGILHTVIRIIDKKTGFYKDYIFKYAKFMHASCVNDLYGIVNKCIIDDMRVWEIGEDPYKEAGKVDYTKIATPNMFNKQTNFYNSYKIGE